jgi:hypothetical protein
MVPWPSQAQSSSIWEKLDWESRARLSTLVLIGTVEAELSVEQPRPSAITVALAEGDEVHAPPLSSYVVGRTYRVRVDELIKSDGTVQTGDTVEAYQAGLYTSHAPPRLAALHQYLFVLSPPPDSLADTFLYDRTQPDPAPVRPSASCFAVMGQRWGAMPLSEIDQVTLGVIRERIENSARPSVMIRAPSDGDQVGGILTLSAATEDDYAVLGVQYQIDGVDVGPELTVLPFDLHWNSSLLVDGVHTVTARARDADGHVSVSEPVSFATMPRHPVFWWNVQAAAATGSTLKKINGADWAARGESTDEIVSGTGYVEFEAKTTEAHWRAGLTHDRHVSQFDIDYAFGFNGLGECQVVEDGVIVSSCGAYSPGSIFRVEVSDGTVYYFKNDSVVFTSGAPATYPLRLAASIKLNGHMVKDAWIGGNLQPVSPPAVSTVPVTWVNVVSASVNGSTLTKVNGSNWAARGESGQQIDFGVGYVEFTAKTTAAQWRAGLTNDAHTVATDIDFAIGLNGSGGCTVYENGVNRGACGSYPAGTKFRIDVADGVVRYFKNGSLFYTSTTPAVYPLRLAGSIMLNGHMIKDARINGPFE